MSAIGSRGSNDRWNPSMRAYQAEFDRMYASAEIWNECDTIGTIVEVCGPENSAGQPKSPRGTSGISFICEVEDGGIGMVEVNCSHSEADLRQNFGSDNLVIGRKVKIKSRGRTPHRLSLGDARIVCDQNTYYVDVRKTGPCSMGAINGVTVKDPLGRLMCFLSGSEGPYQGEV